MARRLQRLSPAQFSGRSGPVENRASLCCSRNHHSYNTSTETGRRSVPLVPPRLCHSANVDRALELTCRAAEIVLAAIGSVLADKPRLWLAGSPRSEIATVVAASSARTIALRSVLMASTRIKSTPHPMKCFTQNLRREARHRTGRDREDSPSLTALIRLKFSTGTFKQKALQVVPRASSHFV